MVVLSIIGCLTSVAYQEARLIAEDIITLSKKTSTPLSLHLKPLIHHAWIKYLSTTPYKHSSDHHDHDHPIIIHSILGYFTSIDAMITWAQQSPYYYEDIRGKGGKKEFKAMKQALQRLTEEDLCQYITQQQSSTTTRYQYAYLDIQIDPRHETNGRDTITPSAAASTTTTTKKSGKTIHSPHRLIFELYPDQCPRAVNSFLSLCQGPTESSSSLTPSSSSLPSLHYINCPIHRVVPHAYFQSGDIVNGNGDHNGSSLIGGYLPAECYNLSHDHPGVLSLVSSSPNQPHQNGTQWMVTLGSIPSFDRTYVAFGQCVYGHPFFHLMNSAVTVDHKEQPIYYHTTTTTTTTSNSRISSPILLRHERPLYPITIAACDQFHTDLLSSASSAWTQRPIKTSPSPSLSSSTAPSIPTMKATILVIGMSGSGKTTIVQQWCGGFSTNSSPPPSTPTIGFELDHLMVENFSLSLYGLGGAANIRGYWSSYYDGAHAVVFVVDNNETNPQYWEEAQQEFKQLIQHEMILQKPLLVMANNKTKDKQGGNNTSISTLLEQSLKINGSHQRILICDAIKGTHVAEGLSWLLSAIQPSYAALDARVVADGEERKKKAKEAMQKRREQLALEREKDERTGIQNTEIGSGRKKKYEEEEKTAS